MTMSKLEGSGGRRKGAHQESIYNLVADFDENTGPKMKSYDVAQGVETVVHRPKPRMHEDSRQVDSLFNPVKGFRDAQRRAGITPTDHAKNNRRAVRQQSNVNAVRKLEEAQGGPNDKAHSTVGRRHSGSTPGSAKPQRSSGGALDEGRDFVRQNIVDAGTRVKDEAPAKKDGSEFLHKTGYGRVPMYLHERKMELAANYARSMAEKEAALIPDGMRMMSEEERLDTLAILQNNREEVENAMQRLPFVIETPSQVRHKNQLERRLQEIEEARKIFSRPKVLVKI